MRRSLPALSPPSSILVSLLCMACAPQPDAPVVRNAVVVCMDTVRYDTFELVDEAAREQAPAWGRAVRFDRAQAAAPWTLPSVASALTGLYPNAHGGGAFDAPVADLGAQWPVPLPLEVSTLPERLGAEGFARAAFVAHVWFDSLFGLAQGFDVVELQPQPGTSADLVERATAWLDRILEKGEQRFFLYLHFMEAHYYAGYDERALASRVGELPPEFRARARDQAPASTCDPTDSSVCQDYLVYVANVGRVRRATEQLLEALAARDLLGTTAVALFSDHGSEFLDHAEAEREHALDPRDAYGRFHGHALYQELLHVPLLFWHPALSGQRTNAPASLVDITPTLLDWLGLEAPVPSQGRSLARSLDGDFDPQRSLFSSGIAYGPEREAVVRGDVKRISGARGVPALGFDLSLDPGEREPTAETSPELDRLLDAYRRARGRAGKPVEPLSPERLSELQALGYLTELKAD